ncbi:hypothetical protein MMC18_007045 [Xylographa bjoerkii]|nr:hypothetical protein [Xylographa bjoerkii]
MAPIVVPIVQGRTDGNSSHVYTGSKRFEFSDGKHELEYLATAWMEDRGEYCSGHTYILDKLPAGYQAIKVWRNPSSANSKSKTTTQHDKYIYGHPGGRVYRTVGAFYPHFKFLMDQSHGSKCECMFCKPDVVMGNTAIALGMVSTLSYDIATAGSVDPVVPALSPPGIVNRTTRARARIVQQSLPNSPGVIVASLRTPKGVQPCTARAETSQPPKTTIPTSKVDIGTSSEDNKISRADLTSSTFNIGNATISINANRNTFMMNAECGILKGGEVSQRTGKLLGPILPNGDIEDIAPKYMAERLGMADDSPFLLYNNFGKVEPYLDKFATLYAARKAGEAGKPAAVDVEMRDPHSQDTRAINAIFERPFREPSWVPRHNEIILWCREPRGKWVLNATTTMFVFKSASEEELRANKWMAGVVTARAIMLPEFAELASMPMHPWYYLKHFVNRNIIKDTYLIEPVLDPWVKRPSPFFPGNQADTAFVPPMQVQVPISQIRPFNHFEHVLHKRDRLVGYEGKPFHASIDHAFKLMSTFSIASRFRFRGVWPDAKFYAKGIYLGAELIVIGDAVQVQPKYWYSSSYKSFILHLTEISVEYRGIPKPQNCITGRARDRVDTWHTKYENSNDIGVYFYGYRYSHRDGDGVALVKRGERDLPSAMRGDTKWYYMGTKDMKVKVRLEDIVGRVYEQKADQAWYGRTETPYYYRGRTSVLEKRWWARNNDPRIDSNDGQDFFWANTHIEGLGVESLTHLPVGYIDGEWNTVRHRLRLRSTQEREEEKKDYHLVEGRDHAVYFQRRGASCIPQARGKTLGSRRRASST